jgi:uncharacterized OB-fold protein
MEYERWIERERRMKVLLLLLDSSLIKEKQICRICQDCGEICLCYELVCPKCNSHRITEEKRYDIERFVMIGVNIRRRFRFNNLNKVLETEK